MSKAETSPSWSSLLTIRQARRYVEELMMLNLTVFTDRVEKATRGHGAKDEVIARIENLLICKAAFEKALFVYPDAHLEMRQGARIILKSKEGNEKAPPERGSSRGT